MKKILVAIISLGFWVTSHAQIDSLRNSLKGGQVSGYWRSFYMATVNADDLKNWNALATGGLLKYETGSFKNFSIGIGYYTSHNLNISNLANRDNASNKESRYEAGLFDVQDLENREIHVLGELYLKYKNLKNEIKLGRMKLKTPYLNPEDGRMIPTLEQGLWYSGTPNKQLKYNLGWITHIAPRSYSKFETVSNSIGIYPTGLNPDGSRSGYYRNLSSLGIGVASLQVKKEKWGIDIWDYFVENIFNTAYLKGYYQTKTELLPVKISGQYLIQNKINNGGNDSPALSYVHDDLAMVWGAQIQTKLPKGCLVSFNYNQITDHGRFLFPREWGRESLFTFQKRERQEGFGDTKSWVVDVARSWNLKNESEITVKIGYGQYYRPDARDFEVNKYAMPANDQFNLDLFYHFSGPFKGLNFEYLVTYKGALNDTYENPNFIINKVDMWNHNFVLNYRLQ